MKIGQTVSAVKTEVLRRAGAKRDFIVRPRSMALQVEGDDSVTLSTPTPEGRVGFEVNDNAHEALAAFTKIPQQYYERLRTTAPALLASNVNTWLQRSDGARMVRILDNKVRHIASDKFNREMENEDLAGPLFDVLERINAEIVSCEITDVKFYVKAVDRTIHREVTRQTGRRLGDGSHAFFKDVLLPAIVVSNSEVGRGALNVRRSILTQGCTNLAVMREQGIRKSHVGARHQLSESLGGVELSDRTNKLKGAALISELRDVINGTFDERTFDANVKRIQGMVDDRIEGDLDEVIDVTRSTFKMTENEAKLVKRHLIEGADLSRYGLFNAITRTAEDLPDYDRASDFERLGGDVIELSPNEWKRISEAA